MIDYNEILKFWEQNDVFVKSNNSSNKNFVFYDGPPFATGEPHYGHLLAGTIKDVVCRYHSLHGKKVIRRFGWDCHGLPIENKVQKLFPEFGSISEFSKDRERVVAFNNKCREIIDNCQTSWETTTKALGRWIDFKNCYQTKDLSYMESVWWCFKKIYEKGLIQKVDKIFPYSCSTQSTVPASDITYKSVTDKAIYVIFKVDGFNLIAYTTTPWTIPANSGLAINKNIKYSLVDNQYVVASCSINELFGNPSSIEDFDINTLIDKTYQNEWLVFNNKKDKKVIHDDFVTEDGTGIVHIAPAYGEDDFRVGKENNLKVIDYLDAAGNVGGTNYLDMNSQVISFLRHSCRLFKEKTITHNYPYYERNNTPLIYRAQSSWVMDVPSIKNRIIENNKTIKWMPEAIGANRFHNWLEESKDWNISRNRVWGTPIPVWVNSKNQNDVIVIGSIEELFELSGVRVTDLHKENIDGIVIHKNGNIYHRTSEVLDCWFESGCMPYAHVHYPFAPESNTFLERFPADFIAEGLDQTRGWFYSLLVIGTALFDKSPFKSVIVNGLVLAEDGVKMSKSKNNYPDVKLILDKYGADAVRGYLISSPGVAAQPVPFSEEGVSNINKNIIIPLLNSVNFLKLASVPHPDYSSELVMSGETILDNFICREYNALLKFQEEHYENNNLQPLVGEIQQFIDTLNNFYIRNSRKNLYNNKDSRLVLHDLLIKIASLIAPIFPFLSEQIAKDLGETQSIHLSIGLSKAFNVANKYTFDMHRVIRIMNVLNNYRARKSLSIKEPIDNVYLCGESDIDSSFLKEICRINDLIALPDTEFNGMFKTIRTPNFKVLGPKFGSKVKDCVSYIKECCGNNIPLSFNDIPLVEGIDFISKYEVIDQAMTFIDSENILIK